MSSLTRRESLALIAAAALAACTTAGDAARPGIFRHGVASGDPLAESLVLWTRVTTHTDSLEVSWQLARDPDFEDLVVSGSALAVAGSDHTVKIVPEGLEAGQTYYYRFSAAGEISPIGRARTLPAGSLSQLGLALASCSNYAFGYFNAYDAISKDASIDFVLHAGDYIYEYGDAELNLTGLLVRSQEPQHETVTLKDYRLRHALHKADKASRAMHAAHTLLACWDDHEVANDPWLGGAQNHQPETEGSWIDRRSAAIQAYYEWMPIREPEAGRTRLEFWRTYRFGDLATLITLETRHSARAKQIEYSEHKDSLNVEADRDAFLNDVLGAPGRDMLSEGMKSELRYGLSRSSSDGEPWRLIGNPGLLARTNVPDLASEGLRRDDSLQLTMFDQYTGLFWKARWGLPNYTDVWDGYPVARQEFYELCQQSDARDLLVLTGDSHSFWANALVDDKGLPMGVELGTAGITAPSDYRLGHFPGDLVGRMDELFTEHNPEVRWTQSNHCGYIKLTLTHENAKAEFVGVSTTASENYQLLTLRTENIVRKNGTAAFG